MTTDTKLKPLQAGEVEAVVSRACSAERLKVEDGHTHLFPPHSNDPVFRKGRSDAPPLFLSGIAEGLTYHYVLRSALALEVVTPEEMSETIKRLGNKEGRRVLARRIWDQMFVKRRVGPKQRIFVGVDEGCLGVQLALQQLGFDPQSPTLDGIFATEDKTDPSELLDRAMKLAGVTSITMTNTPTDDEEWDFYVASKAAGRFDSRFKAALRLDPITLHFGKLGGPKLKQRGYEVDPGNFRSSKQGILDFMNGAVEVLGGVAYAASSFGPGDDPSNPDTSTGWIMEEVILPWCEREKVDFFAMPGAVRQLSPDWGAAGDGVGFSDFAPYQKLTAKWRKVRFLLTVLHEANQHDAMVLSCHGGNTMNVGHWWFNLTPVKVKELVSARLQLLGTRFIAFNSDSRVLENLISKWMRFRRILIKVLTEIFTERVELGLVVTEAEIEDAADALFQFAA